MTQAIRSVDKAVKREYRVSFDESGRMLGASFYPSLGEQLGITLDPDEDHDIHGYIQRLSVLHTDLPSGLDRRVTRLLEKRDEFSFHGDFQVGEISRHLHISGRATRLYSGDVVFTLLFLDDTAHTQLRRLYEYMFRLANHELKSPLACILGAAEFAEGHVRSRSMEGVETCLEMIGRNARLMEEMIRRYLTLSRIESGHLTLDPGDVVFSDDVLNPIAAELRPALLAKGMDIVFEVVGSAREPVIVADREAVGIVVRNLAANAVAYGTADSHVRIELRPVEDGVEISVENEGPNIPESQLKRLFQKFVRLEATQGSKGAGLGLYNARKLVELWGGRIDVASREGKTRFTFSIPEE